MLLEYFKIVTKKENSTSCYANNFVKHYSMENETKIALESKGFS